MVLPFSNTVYTQENNTFTEWLIWQTSVITKRKLLGILAGAPIIPLGGCSQGQAQSQWKFFSGNPVIGNAYGSCFDPYVILDDGLFRMWFSWRPKQAIAYCESRDGMVWSTPRVVLTTDPSQKGQIEVNRCSVLRHNGQYVMYFTGQSVSGSSIYHATSSDGITWSRTQSDPVLWPEFSWEKNAVMCPDIILDEQTGTFRLYYSAGEQYEPDGIGLATSIDGRNWTKLPNPIFTSVPSHAWERAKVTACNVHHVHDWYYMFYIGFADIHHASVCLARSRNGIDNWERHPDNPILSPPGRLNFFQWDRDAIYKPAAVMTETGWVMFFNARRRHVEQIGMATHAGLSLGFPETQ
ncbi:MULTISPECIES: family 43 glycosylhydrolase [Acetobacter]|jgi:predicted GH43/DUF377 family glycosyl hydrolase|uniref:Putative GH43/DUF377 family glycosyl hydrolase n=1 Tax=Acetobacter lovaniensis TaxID=104100 RepID=A0A841QEG2_9PROT|nr:family 43 glycosylhydrolase [Acetobacter lovaniensis]MBB6456840.1 putative GH43/DUF377 family glycosyl hydrolase [Acetobacter lovaniensis]MCI1698796.1 family 43 glycosylhydrolase [Acetobacter lovaniensis]MCP1240127.1 family 43 glycosylhydrolase [Acetobacter lovaniensis]NHN81165.1 family 43 glycosylhydrolase [Acetobacter lovaniensis]GBQ70096.1 hypothetical protein AA0474_2104 [Acetobacter lovaniensis NRIC 0474]